MNCCRRKQGAWNIDNRLLVVYTYADPWVLQRLLGSDSLGRVDSKHLVDQIFSLRGHGVPLRGRELKRIRSHAFPHTHIQPMSDTMPDLKPQRWEEQRQRGAHVVRAGFDLLVEFVLVLVPERRVSNQQDVEDHTYTREHSLCPTDKKVGEESAVRKTRGQRAYHMPRCLQVYRTPPSSAPLGTNSRVSLQSLHTKQQTEKA